MSQLRQQHESLHAHQVKVVVVTFESEEVAQAYAARATLPGPLLLDPQRTLYRSYGFSQASWGKLLGIRSLWTYLRLIFRGRKVRRPTDDVHQLGGEVLVDPEGVVRWQHGSSEPADRPTVTELLAICTESV